MPDDLDRVYRYPCRVLVGPEAGHEMSSMVLDGVSPRSRSTDPTTSVDAGRRAKLHASQVAVLNAMRQGGSWTHFELEDHLREWSPSRIRSAVSELGHWGEVECVPGVFRVTPYGRKARVYRAVSP